VHWGEETFFDLVEHVADLARDAPILLLCMARPDLLDRRPGWGGGKVNATTVLLEPLDHRETELLIESLMDVDETTRARVGEAAEGNPLFRRGDGGDAESSGSHGPRLGWQNRPDGSRCSKATSSRPSASSAGATRRSCSWAAR
jgi:hypothetical protein